MAEHDRQMIADQILKAIEYGKLPREEIERRLNRIIDEELSSGTSDDADMTKVDMCNSLLWRLYTHGEVAYADHSDDSRMEAEREFQNRRQRQKNIRRGFCAAAVVLVMFIGLTMLNVIPPIRWFAGEPTEDEQQYTVLGHELSPQTVSSAIADHEGTGTYATSSEEDMIRYLGFDPSFPEEIAGTHYDRQYAVLMMPDFIRISCQYALPPEQPILALRMTIYSGMEQARIQYEQDKTGEMITVQGVPVYRYMNDGKTVYLWNEANTLLTLTIRAEDLDKESVINDIIARRKEL